MGVGGQHHVTAGLTRERRTVLLAQGAEWPPGPVWTGGENLHHIGIRSPDRPTWSQSLYRLSYPGPPSMHIANYIYVHTRQFS